MNRPATFAQRLSELLAKKNISQAELSRRTGVSKSSITHYIKGDWEGKQDAVYAISQAMNINEAWLMGYDVPMEKDIKEKNPTLGTEDGMDEIDKKFLELYRQLTPDQKKLLTAQILLMLQQDE